MSPSSRMTRIALGVFVAALFSLTSAWAQNWIQLAPVGTPGTPVGPGVFDPAPDRMLALGNGDPHSLWVLSNANGLGGTPEWLQFAPLQDPAQGFPPAKGPSAVYDQPNNRMITFGGCLASCGSPVNDVWVLTNANGLGGPPTWLKLFPTGGPPPPSAGHAAVYDSTSNKMIVFGGQNGCCNPPVTLGDVWVLSNANGLGGTPTWTLLTPTGGTPPGQAAATAVYDSASNRMTVFGGVPNGSGVATNAVWVLSNANGLGGAPAWTNLIAEGSAGAPAGRALHGSVYNPDTNRMTTFGGTASSTSSNTIYNDTWVLTNANGLGATAWTQLLPTGGPPAARVVDVGVLDVASNRMIISGGEGSAGVFTDTWVLTDANGIVTITVGIDIKPGEDPASINPKSRGKIPVAILSRPTFSAPDSIDRSSLTFGRTGDEQSLSFCNSGGQDVNGDGLLDLVCHFDSPETGFQPGDTMGVLKGQTLNNIPIQGSDPVRIVP